MEVVLMIGLQASGKSTFARSTFGATHQYVSKDLLRNNSHPTRRQRQLIEAALQRGISVVVDNTHATREAREELVALGQLYHADMIGYFFAVQVEQCLERNRTREGKARVPDVALFATLKKLTRLMCHTAQTVLQELHGIYTSTESDEISALSRLGQFFTGPVYSRS